MIIFDGIEKAKEKSNIAYIKFRNDVGGKVLIPVQKEIAQLFATHLMLLNTEKVNEELYGPSES